MNPPESAQVFESYSSTYWFDKEGILCIISKNTPDLPINEQKKQMQEFKERIGAKKVCILIDITNASQSSRESRNYNSEELPLLAKAIAFYSRSALGRMLANVYLRIKPQYFPSKIFSDEKAAKEWLKQYL